ncbi:MAG: DUF3137 domain-containing protein [Candidatus Sumerlaeaceae bacterium]|nr:DUF3137 domain-containing protein [Candidatus Sumerlaeaceae bacterium]
MRDPSAFPSFLPLIIAAFVVLVVGSMILSRIQARKRQEALAAFAGRNGLAFDPETYRDFRDRWPDFKCLSQGENRYAYNVLSGPWRNRPLTGFDYHYETTTTDSKGEQQTHHHHFSAVVISSSVPLRPLTIRAENVFDKVAGFFGKEDINFESAEFNRKFFVSSTDRRWAYDVLHTRTMEFLMASPRFAIQFSGDCVMAWKDSTFKPEDFAAAADVISGILERLPEYVLQQQGGQNA